MPLGATGKFPEGKLNEHDQGEIRMAVTVENGNICIHFGKPTAWIGFGPDFAKILVGVLLQKIAELNGALPSSKGKLL